MSAVVSAGVGWGAIAACVGDDPGASRSPNDDGGGGDVALVDAPTDTLQNDAPTDAPNSPAVAIDIASGNGFACAALTDGAVACWGANDLGQTAQPSLGDDSCGGKPCRKPTRVLGLGKVVRVAAGGDAACAITSGGEVYCWGVNENGQLGHANGPDPTCPGGRKCVHVPAKVEGIADVIEVAISRAAACAATKSGRVFCWGSNASGQLGRGSATATFELSGPVPTFDTGSAVEHIASDTYGSSHFCAIRQDGTVWCWGRSVAGEIGFANPTYCPSGSEPCVATPTQVKKPDNTPLASVQSIAATDGATCVSLVGGTVWCWGFKGHAVADAPDGGADVAPKIAAGSAGLSGLAGTHTHVCGLAAGGVVKCWGENSASELGSPLTATPGGACAGSPCSFRPLEVSTIRAARVAAGVAASFALTPDGKVLGWGLNDLGQLGHPATPAEIAACQGPCSPTPVPIALP